VSGARAGRDFLPRKNSVHFLVFPVLTRDRQTIECKNNAGNIACNREKPGLKKPPGQTGQHKENQMSVLQAAQITKLTRLLGIGSRADQGIKHVLGKMPINMSSSRAQSVIDALEQEWEGSDAKADSDHDMFMRLNNYADC